MLLAAAGFSLQSGDRDQLSSALVEDLGRVARGDPSQARDAIDDMIQRRDEGDREYQTVLGDARTATLILDLAASYIVLAVLDLPAGRRIVKFSYEHAIRSGSPAGVAEAFGWTSVPIETVAPAAIQTKSYHAEIEVPEELRITGAVLYDQRSRTIYGRDQNADRAALHAPNVRSPRGSSSFELQREQP